MNPPADRRLREQGQQIAGKNSEAPRLDSELLSNQERRVRNPFFTGFRNGLLPPIHPQNRHCALRWRYKRPASDGLRFEARMCKPRGWSLKLGRYSTELADILAVAHF